MRNAFACSAHLDNKKLIVVDDVMTSGASLEEFARVLRKQGAIQITNWVVARTLPD
jgi:predicted amidophosphoribosyltransferase